MKRVIYIPETLKAELREEIKKEVLAQAKQEGWAAPSTVPEWLSRLTVSGDVRARYELVRFPEGNANGGDFPDFNAINTGKPYDVRFADFANDRYLDVDQDRQRARLRARLGLDADLGAGFRANVRLAAGDGMSPVSTNQTQGAYVGKYSAWIDRASIRFAPIDGERGALALEVGRFANPFLSTELVWDDDVNLDGAAISARVSTAGGLAPFLVAGVFPLQFTSVAFPAEVPEKLASRDKFLLGAQLGTGFTPGERLSVKLGASFHLYRGVRGKESTPCATNLKDVTCDTDDTRPLFAQKGNTYRALRTPSDEALSAVAAGGPEYQYFGLASDFHELVATVQVEYGLGSAAKVGLSGDWARNVAFSKQSIAGVALNNLGACDEQGYCAYSGGADAYLARVAFASPDAGRRFAWTVAAGYRHVESDAVLDAFTDSDFGLGGTNLEGYDISASLAVAKGITVGARWMSADEIAGPTYRVDVLQADVRGRF